MNKLLKKPKKQNTLKDERFCESKQAQHMSFNLPCIETKLTPSEQIMLRFNEDMHMKFIYFCKYINP